jgi:hypothetical protein
MEKQSWSTTFLRTSTAKIYANSKVEWSDNSGKQMNGKVKQIFSDRVCVKSADGSIHIVDIKKLKKVFK